MLRPLDFQDTDCITSNVRSQLTGDVQASRSQVSIGGRIENECDIAYSPSHPGGI